MPQPSPYASHLPVLEAVCGLLKPRRVLELGSGLYSTPFFLSQPIKVLRTVESDAEWREKLPEDPRLRVQGDFVGLDPAAYDLCLVDDGESAPDREASLRWALGRPHPPTVVHDAEVYAGVLDDLGVAYAVIPTAPQTAIVWV